MHPSYLPVLLPLLSLSAAQVIFDGNWTNALGGPCGPLTHEPGSSVVWNFSGTYVKIRGPSPADPATVAVTLDGTPSSLTPSGTGCTAFLYQNTSLPLGSHTLNLTFVGPASNNLSITSFACGVDSSINLAPPPPLALAAPSSTSAAPSNTSAAPSSTSATLSSASTGAKLGGALGGAVGIAALLAAVHLYFKAPSPGASPDFDFFFVFPLPITFRGKVLQDAQITVVLQPAHLDLTDEKPGRGFTFHGSTSYELVAWKIFMLSAKKEGQSVRLPKDLGFGDVEESEGILINRFYNFAPLRTLVTKTVSAAWKSARYIIPGLGAMVVANNAALQPIDFTLGTYHAKKDKMKDDFCPFVVVRGVLNSQFCVVPQCDELVVNAYITQNIGEHQLLQTLFPPADSSYANCPIPDGPSNTQEDPNAAPRPTIEDDDADDQRSSKILSRALIGENGKGELVSTLKHKTKWHLVDDSHGLRLKIVTDDSENITETTGLLEYKA
ncbi:hypothetical protein B0H19DRAFT_1266683 [Mycena capillaripes]|nr:hypothetical protein B0H19DRAFT_1266683 [Mycena capillaripes]